MNDIVWGNCKAGIDEATLQAVEHQLGVRFPRAYRELVKSCQGGAPTNRMEFDLTYPGIGHFTSFLGALLTIDPDSADSIIKTMQGLAYDDQLPSGIVPFGEVGNGDLICFDFNNAPHEPRVAFWAHEQVKEKSIVGLADSFEAFLALLKAPA